MFGCICDFNEAEGSVEGATVLDNMLYFEGLFILEFWSSVRGELENIVTTTLWVHNFYLDLIIYLVSPWIYILRTWNLKEKIWGFCLKL